MVVHRQSRYRILMGFSHVSVLICHRSSDPAGRGVDLAGPKEEGADGDGFLQFREDWVMGFALHVGSSELDGVLPPMMGTRRIWLGRPDLERRAAIMMISGDNGD
ncbi:hypothetical protein ACLOJK_006981 [Asimina triloba]